jgi:hypothetical protein
MRLSVSDPVVTDYEADRRAKKALSDDRQSRWPNTLEAQRRKKENWKVEKMAKEEAERVAIDKKEADLQRRLRIDAIKRANHILYEQTDKMKGLRSAEFYSDVLADREEQLKEKSIKAEWIEQAGGEYHELMMKQLHESNLKAEKEEQERKAFLNKNAKLQKEQLNEVRDRYIKRLTQEKLEGEMIIEKSRQELIEDAEKAAQRQLQSKLAAEEMAIANSNLKKLQLEMKVKEAKEDNKRQDELRAKEQMAVSRKRLEAKRFIEKQNIRQRMIDKACEELSQKTATTNAVMEKQAKEARDREEVELARRAAKREQQREAIDKSRAEHVMARKHLAAKEAFEEAERIKNYKLKMEQLERDEVEKQLKLAEKARNVRNAVEAQILDKQALKDAEREIALREDAQTKAILDEDDLRFKRIAQAAYDAAAAEGKNTIPIEKAMHAKTITLLPASINMRL